MYLCEGGEFQICTDIVDIGCCHCRLYGVIEMKNKQAILTS